MGLVFRAYHMQLERTGAVKVLQAIAPDPDTTARFRHEAQAIAQLRHPNILNVYDFGEYQGTPYMIVEYVPGGSLSGRLSKGRLDAPATLRYLRGIAAGLDHAHSLGIVHRDVKPANVLLETDDTPVLADFGVAKRLQGASLKAMTGVPTGTPAYMAPEQVTGSKVGPAADRYALATIAYEMLTGVIPFDGEGLMELLYAHVHREPVPPSARNHALGPRVDAVIMRGLAKDPGARWESCTAMIDALGAALTHRAEPPAARTVVMKPAAAAAPAILSPADVGAEAPSDPMAGAYPSPPPPVIKRRSRKRLIAIIAIALTVLLIGVAGFLATRPPPGLALTPSTVAAGDSLLVTAGNLPSNQSGEIRLHSALQAFAFHAHSRGHVRQYITVPRDEGIGDHTIQVCWGSACRLTAILHVHEPVPVAPASPTTETSTAPTPTPASSPTPAPTSATTPYVTVAGISQTKGFTAVLHNTGGGTWSIFVYDVPLGKSFFAGSASVPSGSTYYSQHFATPAGVAATNKAYVMACSSVSARCYGSNTLTVEA